MKAKFLSFAAIAAVVAGFSSCSDDTWTPDVENGDGEGKLNTETLIANVVNGEQIINDTKGPKSRAVTDLSDYIITVTDANGAEVANWSYNAMPTLPVFKVGTYTLGVRSHNLNGAAWDEPYFYGEQTFSIVKDQVTDVDVVTCKLANIRVSVKFDSRLLAVAGSDVKVSVTSAGSNSLDFTPSETRSGYFAATEGLKTLKVHFSGTVSGNAEDFTKVLTDVAAGQHRIVTFSLKSNPALPPDEVGTIVEGEGINVSTDVESVDLTSDSAFSEDNLGDGDRPGQEGPEPGEEPDDPTPPVPGDNGVAKFTSETLDLENVNMVSDFAEQGPEGPVAKQSAIVNIEVPKGVKNLVVTIKNAVLEGLLPGVGLASSFDLAEPGDLREALEGNFNFPVAENLIGKTEVTFDITKFVPLLTIYPGEEYEFQIEVTDQEGNSTPGGTLHLKFKS